MMFQSRSAFLVAASVHLGFAAAQSSCSGTSAIIQAYTPQSAACPADFQLVRTATSTDSNGTTTSTLSSLERAYISGRECGPIPPAWNTYLENVVNASASSNLSAPIPDYISAIFNGSEGSFPRLGLAMSGGGYRAASYGAGVLNSLDSRNASSVSIGTGGLLQAASYLTGLSGGAWLVTSAVQAGLPVMQEVAFGVPNASSGADPNVNFGGWNAQIDLEVPSSDILVDLAFYEDIIEEISGKSEAGFPITLTDAWARLLARHFTNGTFASDFFDECESLHGAGELWSGIANLSFFESFGIPFPIITADTLQSNQNDSEIIPGDVIPITNTIYEFNPFEMGSFDPMLGSFVPTQYIGTTNSSVCVSGYDQINFIAGTSSNIFNELNITGDPGELLNSTVGELLELLNSSLPQPAAIEFDAANYPNPFQGVNPSIFADSNQTILKLSDGGESGENVPLQPLLVQARGVDVIIAIDGSSDNDNFADGAALVATQDRTALFPGTYAFPAVPNDTDTFVSEGLATRPTFFGCDESSPVPLVIYIANGAAARGEPNVTNTETLQTTYSQEELQAILDQSFDIATQGIAPSNDTDEKDPAWGACLACAVADRARARLDDVARSGICETCFSRYCWYPSSSNSSSSVSASQCRKRH